ncbi:plant intracellular Ras-group-related LRR protein 7-like protein [Tanacetum coccineum]
MITANVGNDQILLLLNVSHNRLKSLPESVGRCFLWKSYTGKCLIHLKSLCLDNNNLKQVSTAFMSSNSSEFIKRMRDPAEYFFTRQYHIYGSVSTDGGFKEFEDQRKKKFNKQIDSNVMISSKGLDGGVDL